MTEPTEREVLLARYFKWHPAAHLTTVGERNDHLIRFQKMLDAGAYLDAALMLVPDHLDWSVYRARYGAFAAALLSEKGANFDGGGEGQTPSLALCAAIEAAIAREGE